MNSNRLYLYLTTAGAWLILSTVFLVWTNSKIAFLSVPMLAFTSMIGLARPFGRNFSWLAAALSILVVGALMFPAVGFFTYGAIVIAFAGDAIFCSLTADQLRIISGRLERDRNLIEELQVYDPETGLLKWKVARQSLKAEITRSQRFHNDLCLLLMQVEHWDSLDDGFTAASRKELKAQISEMITSTLRTLDISFSGERIGAILPGTRPEGAMIAAERLVRNIHRKAHFSAAIGISHFPIDGVTEEELVKAAETALQNAVASDRSIIQAGQSSYAPNPSTYSDHQPFTGINPAKTDEAGLPAEDQANMMLGPGETGLKICGVQQVPWILDLENSLGKHKEIKTFRVLKFSGDTLYIGLRVTAESLNKALQEITGLEHSRPLETNGWITVTYQETNQAEPVSDFIKPVTPDEA